MGTIGIALESWDEKIQYANGLQSLITRLEHGESIDSINAADFKISGHPLEIIAFDLEQVRKYGK
jgi:hypothetical protein